MALNWANHPKKAVISVTIFNIDECYTLQLLILSFIFFFSLLSPDSSGQLSSSPLSSPTGHCAVGPHPLHPSLLTPSSMGSTPGQLHSPINGLASPFPVISSPMGHPSITGPSSTSMAFGPSLSPQVSAEFIMSCVDWLWIYLCGFLQTSLPEVTYRSALTFISINSSWYWHTIRYQSQAKNLISLKPLLGGNIILILSFSSSHQMVIVENLGHKSNKHFKHTHTCG